MFILGYKYCQKKKPQCQLLNCILGRAKMSVYLSRRNKVEESSDHDAVWLLIKMMKARLKVDFEYYKEMNDLSEFIRVWCYKGVLCSVSEEVLIYGDELIGGILCFLVLSPFLVFFFSFKCFVFLFLFCLFKKFHFFKRFVL